MSKKPKHKEFPKGWKFSDTFPTQAEYTKAKMAFFKENHNGWYVYNRGIYADNIPERFKDKRFKDKR